MGTRILGIVIAVAIVVGIYLGYQHYKQDKSLDNGAVTCTGCMTPEQKAAFDKEDHGETADGQSEHKNETARATLTATPTQMPSQDVAQDTPREPLTQRVGVNTTPDVRNADNHPQSRFGGGDSIAMQPGTPAPAYDSAAPNAPNGARFGGSGSYQWYRQGNLTWRVDTTSGRSCIVYATMEEWRKQIVLSHGCGREG